MIVHWCLRTGLWLACFACLTIACGAAEEEDSQACHHVTLSFPQAREAFIRAREQWKPQWVGVPDSKTGVLVKSKRRSDAAAVDLECQTFTLIDRAFRQYRTLSAVQEATADLIRWYPHRLKLECGTAAAERGFCDIDLPKEERIRDVNAVAVVCSHCRTPRGCDLYVLMFTLMVDREESWRRRFDRVAYVCVSGMNVETGNVFYPAQLPEMTNNLVDCTQALCFLDFVDVGDELPLVVCIEGPSGTGHFAALRVFKYAPGEDQWENADVLEWNGPVDGYDSETKTLRISGDICDGTTDGTIYGKAVLDLRVLAQNALTRNAYLNTLTSEQRDAWWDQSEAERRATLGLQDPWVKHPAPGDLPEKRDVSNQ